MVLRARAKIGDPQAALTLALEINFGSIDAFVSYVMQGAPVSCPQFDVLADALADAEDLYRAT